MKFENDIIGSGSGHRTPGVEIKSVTVPNDRAECGIIRGVITTGICVRPQDVRPGRRLESKFFIFFS